MGESRSLSFVLCLIVAGCCVYAPAGPAAAAGIDLSSDARSAEKDRGTAQPFKPSTPEKTVRIQQNYGKLPHYFIENKGQVDKEVLFYERGAGHAIFFTKNEVVFSFRGAAGETAARTTARGGSDLAMSSGVAGRQRREGQVYTFDKLPWR